MPDTTDHLTAAPAGHRDPGPLGPPRVPVGSDEYAHLAQTGRAPALPVTAPPLRATTLEASQVLESTDRRRDTLPGVPSGLGLRKFRDRLRVPPVIRAWERPRGAALRIEARPTRVRLHADLPMTDAWGYEGSVPGPTIEVRRGRAVTVDWVNSLTGASAEHSPGAAHLPYDVVRVPPLAGGGGGINADFAAAMRPGGRSTRRGGGPDSYPALPHTEELTGATVVHLHGALTNGHNDGWAHNVAGPGEVTRCTYPNEQEAATLWYHDHAMAVTRFNVYAGLAGFYLIRDEQEARLRLPSGRQEVVLALADRNLETEPPGVNPSEVAFTGRPLYKQAGFSFGAGPVGEIPVTGPYTLVNGTIWPTLEVEPRWHRFRLLNASHSRIYRLTIHDTTDEAIPAGTSIPATDVAFGQRRLADPFVVIGTDGGLLPAPVRPAGGALELGPGERMDVLVDFSALRGRTLELRNENGSALNAQAGQADATAMQLTVADRHVRDRWTPPTVLSSAYRRYEHRDDGSLRIGDEVVPHHGHAYVAIIPPGLRGSLHPELWELAEVPAGDPLPSSDLIQVARADGSVQSLHPVAKLFDDPTTIFVSRGEWVVWHLLHLGGPDHPMHIHMTEFQMIARRQWALPRPGGTVPELDLTTGSTRTPLPQPGPGRPIDPVSAGMKDTWVVRAGEWVSVLGHFAGAAGSFMYHCHIMDHEDHTMMRPFVVLPPELMAFHRGHGGGHH